MSNYSLTDEKHPRRFQSHWFKSYLWLEYSERYSHFVSLVIYFQVNHLEIQDQTHLLLNDSIVGRKLMTGNDVLFLLIWKKVQIQLIDLLPGAWKI
jgi:hypothetical protein